MKLVFFVHSLGSCWNHGNAHFLRGVVRELRAAGHDVDVWEPAEGWSRSHLDAAAEAELSALFPSRTYMRDLDVGAVLADADVAIVHEWSEPWLVAAVGALPVPALFHDTHHRAVTKPHEMQRFDLSGYAGVLAFGAAISEVYRERGWHDRVWTWHEAADTALFRPLRRKRGRDLVWIGNWGDDERTHELDQFLFAPARRLRLSGTVYGVRYPEEGIRAVRGAGLDYRGWLPNHRAPEAFAAHRVTIHVPRRPYVEALPGIPTIRVFEALACGIPLVSAPWDDAENLFRNGDFLWARTAAQMEEALQFALDDPSFAERGRATVLARHTCRHRVEELVAILHELGIREEAVAA
jgi:spore maturation protein CgeB